MIPPGLRDAYGVRYTVRMPAVKRTRSRTTDDGRLTRARLVETGLALLAEHGADGLSMRALADALGTAPMSLYRHVRSKDDLLRGIVAAVLARHEFDVPRRGPWTKRAEAWMHGLRRQLVRSPAVVSILMRDGHYAPALLRATNTLLRILTDAGFEGPDAVRASREIMWSTLGFISSEVRGPTFSPAFYVQALHPPERGGDPELRPDDVAEVAAHMPHMLTRDLDEVFGAIARHLLAGLDAELRARTAPRRRTA
jgi:AcrR family transcriptional regulator